MPLSGSQITRLAEELDQQWDLPKLVLLASRLGVNLNNLAPDGSLKEKAYKFILHLNGQVPPRDAELLERLLIDGNARLKSVVNDLLTPTFFSATGNPIDAIVLGRSAFVNRATLRDAVRDFMFANQFSTRVLVVRGDEPCGKSYSWEFLRHLAYSIGALPQRLPFRSGGYTPRQVFQEAGRLLGLDLATLPAMADEPQLARIEPLINWFKGQLVLMTKRYWLVFDDLNDPNTTPAMREAVYALAYAVEEIRAQNLWVALLGYNVPVTDPELRHIAQEDAHFPDAATVAEHFRAIAQAGPKPLTPDKALELADLVFAKYPSRDKASMIQVTGAIENMGEKLKKGLQL